MIESPYQKIGVGRVDLSDRTTVSKKNLGVKVRKVHILKPSHSESPEIIGVWFSREWMYTS
jgi:hypothetical protein